MKSSLIQWYNSSARIKDMDELMIAQNERKSYLKKERKKKMKSNNF